MNNNDLKKAYLQSYIPSINAAKRIEEEIEQLRLDKMMPSVIMDDMPHAHNKTDMSDYMAKLDELINKLIAARYKRIDLYAEIFANIEKMENETEREVLTYRYLRRYSWEKICVHMGYQWAQIHRIHANALKNFNPTGVYYQLMIKNAEVDKDDTQ